MHSYVVGPSNCYTIGTKLTQFFFFILFLLDTFGSFKIFQSLNSLSIKVVKVAFGIEVFLSENKDRSDVWLKKWYFVTIIVLTYCEKKLCNFEFFQGTEAKKSEPRKSFANSRPKAKNL